MTCLLFSYGVLLPALVLSTVAVRSSAQTSPAEPSQPLPGQAGKDVEWLPTSPALVEKMLDLASVTHRDHLVDLGSGEGRIVFAAAKRGARAHGIEYNADLVALSQRKASREGVGSRATFEAADLFESDLSEATVITMFLRPGLNIRLRPALLDLRPGTRIVSNTWGMGEWEPDEASTLPSCDRWCTALLWIVPARVEGVWDTPDGTLILTQTFQEVSGMLKFTRIADSHLRGDEISFTVGPARFVGTVLGDEMEGTVTLDGSSRRWRAARDAQ